MSQTLPNKQEELELRRAKARKLEYPSTPDGRGSARVTWLCKQYYFGKHDTDESRELFEAWKARLVETGEAVAVRTVRIELSRSSRPSTPESPMEPARQGDALASSTTPTRQPFSKQAWVVVAMASMVLVTAVIVANRNLGQEIAQEPRQHPVQQFAGAEDAGEMDSQANGSEEAASEPKPQPMVGNDSVKESVTQAEDVDQKSSSGLSDQNASTQPQPLVDSMPLTEADIAFIRARREYEKAWDERAAKRARRAAELMEQHKSRKGLPNGDHKFR